MYHSPLNAIFYVVSCKERSQISIYTIKNVLPRGIYSFFFLAQSSATTFRSPGRLVSLTKDAPCIDIAE